jgi:hypothetical protein
MSFNNNQLPGSKRLSAVTSKKPDFDENSYNLGNQYGT